ncbi:hypothetical protein KAR91_44200 [Candidatus Pacearchaeota archaeon]|nr:hypothetical protein [Candidatus Pacearchaeota archaeon]
MNRPRYSPRLTGAGRRMVKQVLDKGLVRVFMTPLLRAKVIEEFGCTEEDIDKAVRAGITDFDSEFRAMLRKQRAEMVPPSEDNNGNNLGSDDKNMEIGLPGTPKEEDGD